MAFYEVLLDFRAYVVKTKAWIHGLWTLGFDGARKAAAGLA